MIAKKPLQLYILATISILGQDLQTIAFARNSLLKYASYQLSESDLSGAEIEILNAI